jgi:predicted DCC family thiol-disulfide oxidoreductase YuxK
LWNKHGCYRQERKLIRASPDPTPLLTTHIGVVPEDGPSREYRALIAAVREMAGCVVVIASAINWILSDDSMYRRIADNALRVTREKYCYEVESRKLLDEINRLAGEW